MKIYEEELNIHMRNFRGVPLLRFVLVGFIVFRTLSIYCETLMSMNKGSFRADPLVFNPENAKAPKLRLKASCRTHVYSL